MVTVMVCVFLAAAILVLAGCVIYVEHVLPARRGKAAAARDRRQIEENIADALLAAEDPALALYVGSIDQTLYDLMHDVPREKRIAIALEAFREAGYDIPEHLRGEARDERRYIA